MENVNKKKQQAFFKMCKFYKIYTLSLQIKNHIK